MNSYRYRITVEALADSKGQPTEAPPLKFEAANHDDLLALAEAQRTRLPYDPDTNASLMIGLKLLAEVALTHRKDPLFEDLMPALRNFIGKLKQAGKPTA